MSPRRIAALLLLALALLVFAAATLGCEATSADDRPAPTPSPGLRPQTGAAQPSATGPVPTLPITPSPPGIVDIPIDDRAVVSSGRAALPIRGGTLLLTVDGKLAIAADPERDLVSIIDVFGEQLEHTLELEPGDEPSRLVLDGAGLVHVVLSGSDRVASVDPSTGELLARREVCRAPRGIAYDAVRDVLHTACATGELWTLPAAPADDAPVRRLSLPLGLRDVLVDGDRLWVSRFKSAELLELDAAGNVVATRRPNPTRSSRGLRATEVMMPRFAPNGAYRIALAPDGGVAMLHQRALVDAIKLDPDMPASANGYYGGSCGGIVESAITVFMPDGKTIVSSALPGTLAVDLAMSSERAAVAFAGGPDISSPRPASRPVFEAAGALLIALSAREPVPATAEVVAGCDFGMLQATTGQLVSVAQRADGAVVVAQSREPAQLEILRKPGGSTAPVIALAQDSVLDTGHELFHRSPDGGVTCASCHLEGGEDGHVWSFDPLGPRRTQAVDVGLAGTEPFHWDGDMPDLNALLEEVMVVRMGGVHQSSTRVQALADFMSALRPLPASLDTDDPAAVRGKALFESSETRCAECHAGAALTSPDNHDVGTGEALQVPSLRGVEQRAPFLHDGCAPTLRARFDDPCGGGDQHGHTSQLAAAQIDDLVAYLRSL